MLLLDRADFPRDKCCGDGIAPHVLDELATVGVHGIAEGWAPLSRLRLARGPESVNGELARPVWVIPREVFDARLVERATAAGAVLRRQRVTSVRPSGASPLVDDVSASVVVGADGAHSLVKAAIGQPPASRRALALRGYAPTPVERAGSQIIVYGERRQPSYAWAFDRGDGLSNVGYGEVLHNRAGPPSRALMLEQLDELIPGAGEHGAQWKGHHLPLSGFRWDQPDGPVLLAGDAADLINPLTGEGIFYAVATGLLAGRAAATAITHGDPSRAGALHRRGVRRLLARHLRHTWLASRLSSRTDVVDAGIRAARRDPRVFDDLVGIGLGRGLITARLAGGLLGGLVGALGRSEPAWTSVKE